jgi:glyoxylase-like metal-dependent hydrolase (beta-lactamase superfamily II)
MLRTLALTLCVAALAWPASSADATAPLAKTQAPGYYRMMLGDFEVTALSDGTVDLHVKDLLTNTTAARIQRALARAYLKDPVETSVNGFLVNTGTKLVLVDAGAGSLFGPTLGKLAANLKAAGYAPEQVDEIYITHMHPDHVGGLAADGKAVFPNAVVRADKREADFWLSKANLDGAAKDAKSFFEGAQASMKPYVDAGRFKTFEGDTELAPGVQAVATSGHTPGHTMYVFESKGQRLFAWGDLMHVAAVQFSEPAVTIRFDVDSKAAAVKRKKEFAYAAQRGHWVAASHLSFPGIGRLRADGKGYNWYPANYSVPR